MKDRVLLEDLRRQAASLDGLYRRIEESDRRWRAETGIVRAAFLDSLAMRLADYYGSCERIFERITSAVNGARVDGEEWHKILLDRMTLDVPGVRPPVISESTRRGLDELRKFRHAMRHLYGLEIEEAKLERNLHGLPDLHAGVTAELGTFLDALGEMWGDE